MAGKALLAFELICFSWLFVVYGRHIIHGGREILTIKRAEARELKHTHNGGGGPPCDRSVADFVLQETVNGLDTSSSSSLSSPSLWVSLHRNGEVDACTNAPVALTMQSLDQALHAFRGKACPQPEQEQSLNKYMVESLLTEFWAQSLDGGSAAANGGAAAPSAPLQCASTDTKKNKNLAGFRGFCDMGLDRTVPQPDSIHLVEGPMGNLPCRFYTREGVRISSLEQLVQLVQTKAAAATAATTANQQRELSDDPPRLKVEEDAATTKDDDNNDNKNDENDASTTTTTTTTTGGGEEKTNDEINPTCASSSNDNTTTQSSSSSFSFDLYAVPAGRVFMFAPKFVGEIFALPHVLDQTGQPLSLEVLSLQPRVFDIHNFFSESEAQELIDKAIREQSETHKLHRSTTGTIGASVFNRRTSENAWDTHGTRAQVIKKRCMSALGFDEYYESHTDGLQILRYNLTTAYVPHMDYLTDVAREKYDYRSEGRGGNRFATILLYMSDLEESWGGETVFSKGERHNNKTDHIEDRDELTRHLRESGEISMLEPGSWEETMTITCRTKLSVRPQKSRAVLFYSQFPNGTVDNSSEHGGCPVLQGTKWAANLWVWNAARKEFDHAPFKFGQEEEEKKVGTSEGSFTSVSALFFNSGQDERFNGARLYWHDQYFGELGVGESVRVNTYVTHVWNVKDRQGNTLHTWTINQASSEEQHFTV
ncbi:hypothetical protein ACA910_005566 [Epithemia clementina (nom. ined.)]